jgi:exodeoxyribonuclease VII large subunit
MVQVRIALRQSRVRLSVLMKQRADYERQKLDSFRLKLRMNGPEGRTRDARQRLSHLQDRIAMLAASRVKEERHRAEGLHQLLEHLFTEKYRESLLRTEQLKERLNRDMAERIRMEKHRMELIRSRLDALSPEAMLDRGYVYAQDEEGKALLSASQVEKGERILLYMKDGSVRAAAEEIRLHSAAGFGGAETDA